MTNKQPEQAQVSRDTDVPEIELDLENKKVRLILDAAHHVFLEQGYDAATTDQIARTAGVSKATMYVYFKSKESLLKAMVQREIRTMTPILAGVPVTGPFDIREVLVRIAAVHTELVLTRSGQGMHRLVLGLASRFPEVGQIFYDAGPRQIRTQVAAVLRAAVERGYLDIPDVDLAATQFLTLALGELPHNRLIALPVPSRAEVSKVIESGVDLFMRGYAPAGGPKAPPRT
ncbi:MAG: TetR/AcrR family transcriptional regulator [Alphaproteobacteria bacterium]|nr:MAG: TetR/AcrR family transcriptional regulator [Alphaproteobacteria bacterium]